MHFIKFGRGRLLCGVGGFEKENSEIETDELIQFLVGGEELKEREKRGRGKKKKKIVMKRESMRWNKFKEIE